MRLLLDTHIFVWAASGDERLPRPAAELIVDPANSRTVSVASAWEISIKVRSGRWPDATALLDDFAEAATDLDSMILPIELADAIEAGRFHWDHRDPFDRMLAAQARIGGYRLLTIDRVFDSADLDLAL